MPRRLSDLVRTLRAMGVNVEKPKRGSHWKAKRAGDGVYPIPAHNGPKSEITDVYIKGIAAHFKLDLEVLMGRKKTKK